MLAACLSTLRHTCGKRRENVDGWPCDGNVGGLSKGGELFSLRVRKTKERRSRERNSDALEPIAFGELRMAGEGERSISVN